ncbi:MAG: GNAT family N-acetyltransferase [Thermoanaerobaculia bacterium]|nr:GNAT family N-acetyltransferase [Thermoanaerobaculia bacterium]
MFRIIPDGKAFSEYALLRNGESVLLRVATPDDVPAVEALMQGVSRESLQMRFMGAVANVARSTVEFMCSGEPHDRLSLLAIAGQGPDARVMAIGTYTALGVGGKAEVAFLVHDEFQGRGISTLLLERLAGIAAGYGFIGFEAEVLYENQAMIDVFTGSGFEVCQAEGGGGCIHVQFPVSGVASLRERVELRDRIAAANSLAPLLKPRAIAVVGASRDPSAVGSMIFRAILRGGFTGAVYPVNNQTASVQSVRAYPSMADLPERVDLAVVAVPAPRVLEVAEEALRAGAKALLVVTSGFAESGPEGAALQRELVTLVRSHGARLVGPNCLGVMNTHPDTCLNASLAPELVPQGRIGFFSHSAALGLVILDYAAERGLGFSSFVSAGNRADVSGNDLLQYWEEDASTDVALLYLETFGNPRRFARVARRLSYRKPILCVKSARSRVGAAAARAHIDAAAMSDTNVDVLFRQAGVIRAETLEEMFDVSLLLASQPLPRGNRVAIISNSGGVLTICADACDANGLSVEGTGAVDLGALATVEEYERAVEEAVAHDGVDALVVIFACIGGCDPKVVGRGIRRGVLRAERKTGVAKPVLLCLMGQAGVVRLHGEGAADPAGAPSRHVFPSYRFPESAALALSRAVQYAAHRQRPGGQFVWYEDVDAGAARQEVTALLSGSTEDVVWLEGESAWSLLKRFGISTGEVRETGASAAADHALVEVVSDPSFGPLVRLSRPGFPPVVRITPLTDHDVREIVETAGLPLECGVDELLGRMSQLVEELPWLQAMQARIHRVEHAPGSCGVVLEAAVRIALSRRENPVK